MSAPTPTSALVHSSTLVTAGVYLLSQNMVIRLTQFFIVLIIALTTIRIANISALNSWDFKKLVALSTLRQMSILFVILCVRDKSIIINHLLNHASFKSLLFLRAGGFITLEKYRQDVRVYNILFLKNPLIVSIFLIRVFGLIGVPY